MILQANIVETLSQFIFPALLFLVIYLFFIRPQAQKQKAQKSFESELEQGKKVETSSGIIGTITKLDEHVVTLQISQKGYLDIMRSAISSEMTESINKDA